MNKTKNAIYLHFPKTASSWMSAVLSPITVATAHKHEVPVDIEQYQNVFCFVRNPWDWYVSFYSAINNGSELYHSRSSDQPSPIKKKSLILSLPKNIDFTNFVILLSNPTDEFKNKLAANITAERKIFGKRASFIEEWQKSNLGLYESLYKYYTNHATMIGKYENLKDDLVSMIKTAGDFNKEVSDNISNLPPTNVTANRKDYREYYTDETKNLVFQSNEKIIGQHNYKF
jgi:hypothetical protein